MLFTADGAGINGAFVKPDIHQVGGCICRIQTDNLDESLKLIEENGGSPRTERQDVDDAGWFALFTDPDGNPMGLWDNKC